MRKTFFFFVFTLIASLSFSEENLEFRETWGYVLIGNEDEFSSTLPISDICCFSAEVNEDGSLVSIPKRENLPSDFKGKVHLSVICENYSLSHFVFDPKYGISKKLIKELVNASKDYDGLNIDFELISKKDAKNFHSFLIQLKKSLDKNKILSVCVHARTAKIINDPDDYETLSSIADRIFIMAYDQHWAKNDPGPIAEMNWLEEIIDHALKTIPEKKIIIGLPFYGRTWVEPNFSKSWYNSGINRILNENNNPEIKRVNDIPSFEFKTEITVLGWFDDKDSLVKRCELLKSKGILNVGFWRIGQEDPNFWEFLSIQKTDSQ